MENKEKNTNQQKEMSAAELKDALDKLGNAEDSFFINQRKEAVFNTEALEEMLEKTGYYELFETENRLL